MPINKLKTYQEEALFLLQDAKEVISRFIGKSVTTEKTEENLLAITNVAQIIYRCGRE